MQEPTIEKTSTVEVLDRMQQCLARSASRARLVLGGEFSFDDLTENSRHLDLSSPLESQLHKATIPD
jgi:hypothetical protein